MKYSAGIVSASFWLLETKTTAEYMLDGLSKSKILDLSLNENIYQVDSERRAKDIANVTYRRLKDFPEKLLEFFVNADVNSSKIIVLISILKNDKLLFEFMYEIFREHIILGNYTLKKSDFDIFFKNKSQQSEIIENWAEKTIKKLSSRYRIFLSEAGLLEKDDKDYKIILPFLDFRLRELLVENDFEPYVKAICGESWFY